MLCSDVCEELMGMVLCSLLCLVTRLTCQGCSSLSDLAPLIVSLQCNESVSSEKKKKTVWVWRPRLVVQARRVYGWRCTDSRGWSVSAAARHSLDGPVTLGTLPHHVALENLLGLHCGDGQVLVLLWLWGNHRGAEVLTSCALYAKPLWIIL